MRRILVEFSMIVFLCQQFVEILMYLTRPELQTLKKSIYMVSKYILPLISSYLYVLEVILINSYVDLAATYDHISRDLLFSSIKNRLPSSTSEQRNSIDPKRLICLVKIQTPNHFKPHHEYDKEEMSPPIFHMDLMPGVQHIKKSLNYQLYNKVFSE